MKAIKDVIRHVIGAAFKIHCNPGGLLEKAYIECLFYELQKAGLFVRKEYFLPLVYTDVR
jgi:GxxExxY protein